jgi:glutaredoxin
MTSGHTAVLYTKEGCHLCERARDVLRRLQADFALEVEEIDITTRAALYEEYRYVIPVVVIDGRHRFEPNKIAEHNLRKVLSGPKGRWPWQTEEVS